MNPVTSSPSAATIFFYDCEVDGIDVNTANMTEVCVSNNERGSSSKYFVSYISKSEFANYDGPYQKTIPNGKKRYSFKDVAQKMIHFVDKNAPMDHLRVLMGTNVLGWDEPVLRKNFERFGVDQAPLANWKFFDIAKVAHSLGFPMGTTQQQFEVALCLKDLPANRHRAHADVKVVKEIWRRMTNEIAKNEDALNRINQALLEPNSEEVVANLLREYDPTLIPSREALDLIDRIKQAEKIPRKEIVVGFDTETTGLFPDREKAAHHNVAPRIVQLGAKIFSPYKEAEYQNESFESFVNPGVPIPEEATAIHGITNEEAQEAPGIDEVWVRFEAWVKSSHTFQRILAEHSKQDVSEPRIILVGYNNSRYDNPLSEQELLSAGIDLKRMMAKGVIKSWDALPLMSTWYTDRPASARPPSNKLQDHARFLGIPEADAHRALGDVKTLEKVLNSICDPVDPATLITECVNKDIQFSSPGVGFKEIIRDIQDQVGSQEVDDEALHQAIDTFLTKEKPKSKKQKRTESNYPPRKKNIKEEPLPDTQTFVVDSQAPSSQKIIYS